MNVLLSQLKHRLEILVAKELGSGSLTLEAIPSSRDNFVFSDISAGLIIRVGLTKSYTDTVAEVKLLKYLKNHGFPAPEVLLSGSIAISDNEYPFVVFRYVDHLHDIRITKQQVRLAAKVLGKLHGLTFSYCQANHFEQHRTLNQALAELRHQLINKNHAADNKNQLLSDLEWGISFYESRDQDAPELVIHNDYRNNNVLFDSSGRIACVIDFDWSLRSPFAIKDLGHSAMEWCYPNGSSLNREFYEHFVNQYWDSETPMSEVPLAEVWEWSRFSALADAAHYFLSFPERTKDKFQSYMYDKYLFFKDHEA